MFPTVKVLAYSSDQTDATNRRLGSGIFTLDARILEYITDRLYAIPRRVEENDIKLTLDRIDELESQISAVAKLHRDNALMRRNGKRPLVEPYVEYEVKLSPPVAAAKELHHVGITQAGKHLYERVSHRVVRPSGSSAGSNLTQMSIGAFSFGRGSSRVW